MASRGIRNHNPGNIDYHANTPWQGLADPPTDGRFCRFKGPAWGIRALARTLITYQDKHGIRTIRGVINRWAPPNENNTDAYVAAVATHAGLAPGDPINLHEYTVLRYIVEAIIKHENGSQPYSRAQIDEGLKLAGVVGKRQSTATRKEAVASYLGGAGLLGETLTSQAQQVQMVAEYSAVLRTVFVLLLVAGVGLSIYAAIANHRKEAE